MFGARSSWVRVSKHLRNIQRKHFCSPTSPNKQELHHSSNGSANSHGNNNGRVNNIRDLEAYRDLDKLDFMKAAKILFSTPPKKKKFGLDFHLVQLFFALMPSLAVYLVAQYARHEMKKMDAELEVKKKAEEDKKAKEKEAIAAEEKEKESDLLKVKERLGALEETVKEIVVETKKQTSDETSKNAAQIQEREDPKTRSDDGHPKQQDREKNGPRQSR